MDAPAVLGSATEDGHAAAAPTYERRTVRLPRFLGEQVGAHLADRLDRLHTEAAVHPACTDAPVAALRQGKDLVADQALLVEVGDSNSTAPISSDRPADIVGPMGRRGLGGMDLVSQRSTAHTPEQHHQRRR